MTEKILKNHLNSYFIETGTHTGRAIDIALKVGFDKIISIEVEKKYYEFCKNKFKDKNNVVLYHEDTLNVFWKIIKPIEVPITFWLDAHVHPGAKVGKYKVPLLQELKIIEKHHIKTHTILIDDVNYFGKKLPEAFAEDRDAFLSILKQDVVRHLLDINSEYKISYAGHFEYENEDKILIAKI